MKIDRTAGYNDPIYDESDVIDLLNLIVRRELAAKDQSFTKKKFFFSKKFRFLTKNVQPLIENYDF